MSHRRMGVLFVLPMLALAGCWYPGNDKRVQVQLQLQSAGEFIRRCHEEGVDFSEGQSSEDFIQAAVDRRIPPDNYTLDSWGRPLRWESRREGDVAVVRVTSDGSDGVPQGGAGDDQYVEIRFPPSGKSQLSLKPLR